MLDARAVGFRQPLPDLRGDVEGVVEFKRSPSDPVFDRLAVVTRHDEVELPVVGLVDLVNSANVRVV